MLIFKLMLFAEIVDFLVVKLGAERIGAQYKAILTGFLFWATFN